MEIEGEGVESMLQMVLLEVFNSRFNYVTQGYKSGKIQRKDVCGELIAKGRKKKDAGQIGMCRDTEGDKKKLLVEFSLQINQQTLILH